MLSCGVHLVQAAEVPRLIQCTRHCCHAVSVSEPSVCVQVVVLVLFLCLSGCGGLLQPAAAFHQQSSVAILRYTLA